MESDVITYGVRMNATAVRANYAYMW